MSSENPISRRDLVSNLGAGIAGVALSPAVSAAQAQTSTKGTAAPFVDPTSKYPKPPYPGQSQPWPGLASKMNPAPITARPVTKDLVGLPGEKRSSPAVIQGWDVRLLLPMRGKALMLPSAIYPTEEPDAS